MATGKTHDWVTWGLLLPVFLVCRGLFHWNTQTSLLVTLGTAIGGLLLSPDLDTKSRPFHRWGIFRFIWLPYQWIAPHRSGMSHGLVLAPWFRLLYLSAVLIVFYSVTYLILANLAGLPGNLPRWQIVQFLNEHLNDLVVIGLGIWLGSIFHVLLDALGSGVQTNRYRR